jgi:hypothetical protein
MSLVITKQTGNFFSLVFDGGDPIISEKNRLTTFGNYCNFKTDSGANIILKQNILVTDITVIADGTFTFANINLLWAKLIEIGFFDGTVIAGTPTGINRFEELLDTFTFFGRDGQVVVVNETEMRLDTVTYQIFTEAEKLKLAGIETNAQVNVQSDVNETDPNSPAYIRNFPDINNVTNTIECIRFAGLGQVYELPINAVAIKGYINDGVQHLEKIGFETDLNTFTQDGIEVTFKKTILTGQRIIIYYYI